MKNRKLLIWTTEINNLLDGDKIIGGIAVQLFFWAQVFADNHWDVETFTHKKSFCKNGIFFKHIGKWGKFEILHDWIVAFVILLFYHPDLVIFRGADRKVLPLALFSKIFGNKFVLFGASDTDFVPNKEIIAGGKYNRIQYELGIRLTRIIVSQNSFQAHTLKKNYNKPSLLLSNIWGEYPSSTVETIKADVIWVSNLRRLKRPEWFIRLAHQLPQYSFVMIGGPMKDLDYYNEVKAMAASIPNLLFLSSKPFAEVNAYVAQARVLVCTSEFEGFPNTFLQAWATDIPVISTVDPSSVIKTEKLGYVIKTENELNERIVSLLSDKDGYRQFQQSINTYFESNHNACIAYHKLLNFINS